MEEQPVSRKRQIVATLAVLIVIVVIVGAVTITSNKKSDDSTAATNSQSASGDETAGDTATSSNETPAATTGSTDTATNTSNYTDGTYSAEGEYQSPGGDETITIKVTLANGIITDTSATAGATDSEAEEYQNQFISGYKSLVVGKSIDSVSLSRVSGSSLTSQGFNDAIDQIKSDASIS